MAARGWLPRGRPTKGGAGAFGSHDVTLLLRRCESDCGARHPAAAQAFGLECAVPFEDIPTDEMRSMLGPTPNSKRCLGSTMFTDQMWSRVERSLRLSRREVQIVRGVFDDLTEDGIAASLGISAHTVHTHVERLHHKLSVVDRAQLILRIVEECLRLGLVIGCAAIPTMLGR